MLDDSYSRNKKSLEWLTQRKYTDNVSSNIKKMLHASRKTYCKIKQISHSSETSKQNLYTTAKINLSFYMHVDKKNHMHVLKDRLA